MNEERSKVLVAGATGALGTALARALYAEGYRCALAGRDETRLAELAGELDGAPTATFDAIDTDSCARAVADSANTLDGLDVLVVAIGLAAFGRVEDTDEAVVEHLLAVNTLAPIALTRAALPYLQQSQGTVVVLSAVLADYPTPEMAAYSASKGAVSTWLSVLRREQRRRKVQVFDVRAPHMNTGLADRALAGTAPSMPEPTMVETVVNRIVDGVRTGAHELSYDLRSGEIHVA